VPCPPISSPTGCASFSATTPSCQPTSPALPTPIEVFTYAATISTDLAARVEAEMTGQELAAVATAAPTPYVHDLVTAGQNSGRSVSVVSNNSARAVHAYLGRHGLDDRISLVVARTSHDPTPPFSSPART
jgi:beta-phosphoglucomutase-like phosphatase (HAD superfamily)